MDRTKTFRAKGISLDDVAWLGYTGNDIEASYSDEGDLVVRRYMSGSDDYAELYLKKSGRYVRLLDAKHKLDATTAPTTGNDSTQGYSVGSIWIDRTNKIGYMCVSATVTSAVWTQVGGTGGGGTATASRSYVKEYRFTSETSYWIGAPGSLILTDMGGFASYTNAGWGTDASSRGRVFLPFAVTSVSFSFKMRIVNHTGAILPVGTKLAMKLNFMPMAIYGVGTAVPVAFDYPLTVIHYSGDSTNESAVALVNVSAPVSLPAGGIYGVSVSCDTNAINQIGDLSCTIEYRG